MWYGYPFVVPSTVFSYHFFGIEISSLPHSRVLDYSTFKTTLIEKNTTRWGLLHRGKPCEFKESNDTSGHVEDQEGDHNDGHHPCKVHLLPGHYLMIIMPCDIKNNM